MAIEAPSISSRTDFGAAPSLSTNVTPKDTVAPTVAGFGEQAGSESRPVWPVAEPTAKAKISSANSNATKTLAGSRPRRRTGMSVMF
jgi:hypothetical protein